MTLLTDYYGNLLRQGPGSESATLRALELSECTNIHGQNLHVADMGCGTGATTLILANALPHAKVLAVDLLQGFLKRLQNMLDTSDLSQRVSTLHTDMATHDFASESFHMIWSEGAIYNIGFEKGIAAWHPLLKDDGLLVVSEITWLTHTRPKAIQSYWEGIYPEIDCASAKIQKLEQQGYVLKGYFPLSSSCWLENYYAPQTLMQTAFLERHKHSEEAKDLVREQQEEARLYTKYQQFYGYGMYVAQKMS